MTLSIVALNIITSNKRVLSIMLLCIAIKNSTLNIMTLNNIMLTVI
jgi:hypothetical protein